MKKRQLWGLALVVVLAVFLVGWSGVLDRNDQHMNGKWTFWKDVDIIEDLDVTATLTVDGASTLTGNVTASGDVDVTGSVTISDELNLQTYNHASGSGLTWSTTYGNILLCSGTTTIAVTLPAMTATNDGYILIVKNLSAVTPTLTPNNADYIETTQGTMTGTSDATNDAAGDVKAWVYDDFGTSTSGVWTLLWADQA